MERECKHTTQEHFQQLREPRLRLCGIVPRRLTRNPLAELISEANCVCRGRHSGNTRVVANTERNGPVVSALLLIQKAVAAPQRYTLGDAFCIAYSTVQWAVDASFEI